MTALKGLFTPEVRRYIYRVAMAVLVLLGVLGVVSDELYTPLVGIVLAVLGLGLADANVPTKVEQKAIEEVHEDSVG